MQDEKNVDETVLDRALELAREAAAEAGSIALSGFRQGARVTKKGRIDLVTEYDLRCEEMLRAKISAAYPSHRIVAEEGAEGELEGAFEEGAVWLVDPIDGTTNFAHGHPFFSVSLSLWEGGVGMLGVVCAPALGVTWWGRRGGGAFRSGERIRVSEREALADALCATGFPYDRAESSEDNTREVVAFIKAARGVRRCGSAALDLSLVADGTYDFYWEQKLKPWDMCGGALLVEEAGGRLSDYEGERADPRSGRLVASNGRTHEEGLALLRRARTPL